MAELLTLAQIFERFPNHWVLVADPQTNEQLEVESGEVRFASFDRDEVYDLAIELRLPHTAVLYTGRMPLDTAVVL